MRLPPDDSGRPGFGPESPESPQTEAGRGDPTGGAPMFSLGGGGGDGDFPDGRDGLPDDSDLPGGDDLPDDSDLPGGDDLPDDSGLPGGDDLPDDSDLSGCDDLPDGSGLPGGGGLPVYSDLPEYGEHSGSGGGGISDSESEDDEFSGGGSGDDSFSGGGSGDEGFSDSGSVEGDFLNSESGEDDFADPGLEDDEYSAEEDFSDEGGASGGGGLGFGGKGPPRGGRGGYGGGLRRAASGRRQRAALDKAPSNDYASGGADSDDEPQYEEIEEPDMGRSERMSSREPLFMGDMGTYPADTRRLLARLLKGPFIDGRFQRDLWAALIRDEALVREWLGQVFLELVLDTDYKTAFTQQLDAQEFKAPVLMRKHTLNFMESVLIIQLRQRLIQSGARGERAVVTGKDMANWLEVFNRRKQNDPFAYQRQVVAAVTKLSTKYSLIRKLSAAGDRYEISPALRLIVQPEEIAALQAVYEKILGSFRAGGDDGSGAGEEAPEAPFAEAEGLDERFTEDDDLGGEFYEGEEGFEAEPAGAEPEVYDEDDEGDYGPDDGPDDFE